MRIDLPTLVATHHAVTQLEQLGDEIAELAANLAGASVSTWARPGNESGLLMPSRHSLGWPRRSPAGSSPTPRSGH
jgi:hypothetical protein